MKHILTSWRRRPGPFVGTLVALILAAVLMTAIACLMGTSVTWTVAPERLAGATVVVTGRQEVHVTSGTGANASTDTLSLPSYRRVPATLATRLTHLPGVAESVADMSFPLGLQLPNGRITSGTATTGPFMGHGWQSAVLTPFVPRRGHAPQTATQVVVGVGLATRFHLRVGDAIRLAGEDLPAFGIVGNCKQPQRGSSSGHRVVLHPAEAAALTVTLVGGSRGIIADPGVRAGVAARVRSSLGSTFTVWTGERRGKAEYLGAERDALNLRQFASQVGGDLIVSALFVLATAVALSVAQRCRSFFLLRAA